MVNLVGLPTRPVTESMCVSQLKLGTAPWFLTKSAKWTLLKSTLHKMRSKQEIWMASRHTQRGRRDEAFLH